MPADLPPNLTASLDKAIYNVGETMTLTVNTTKDVRDVYVDEPIAVHVDLPSLGFSGDVAGQLHRNTGTWAPIVVTDSGRVWTLATDDGNEAKYTATA